MSTPAPGRAPDLRGRRQLEDRGRELQRVLPLPAGPPAAQQADARTTWARTSSPTGRGRAAGWSSPTGCETMSIDGKRNGRPLLYARDEAEARRIFYYILWPNLIVSVHPDYVLTHQAWPDGPNRSTVHCDLYVEAADLGTVDVSGRGGVLGHHEPGGLPRRRDAAAGHALAQLDGGALLEPGGLGPRLRPDGRRPLRDGRRSHGPRLADRGRGGRGEAPARPGEGGRRVGPSLGRRAAQATRRRGQKTPKLLFAIVQSSDAERAGYRLRTPAAPDPQARPQPLSSAEPASRRAAEDRAVGGLIVALPLTSGPVAFFLALDYGAAFAAEAVVGSLGGLVAIVAVQPRLCGRRRRGSGRAPGLVAAALRLRRRRARRPAAPRDVDLARARAGRFRPWRPACACCRAKWRAPRRRTTRGGTCRPAWRSPPGSSWGSPRSRRASARRRAGWSPRSPCTWR